MMHALVHRHPGFHHVYSVPIHLFLAQTLAFDETAMETRLSHLHYYQQGDDQLLQNLRRFDPPRHLHFLVNLLSIGNG
jgi:hypothetical protein